MVIGEHDVIGNAYMYLISNFASDAGRKGGEFYTPTEVAILLLCCRLSRSLDLTIIFIQGRRISMGAF